ncbi:unnamed protein product [Cylicostephanus goldi]|uniref:LIM zinc-binding domain-containing protein n=1 Tax=Cylicostephanus goldi TaxID=71465 RepID=A0A3P6UA30_CYLGO|nr:unnamed protein product [Cylicostephanus goldi]
MVNYLRNDAMHAQNPSLVSYRNLTSFGTTHLSVRVLGIGGAKFISFEDRHWHNDCFICAQCTTSLVGKGFITDGTDILCPECAKARLMAANS